MTAEEELLDRNPNDPIPFRSDEFLSVLIEAIGGELDAYNAGGNQVSKNLFVQRANDTGLSQIGRSVNEPPRDGESTEQYRGRIRAALGKATSDATVEQFATIALQLLNTTPGNIAVESTGEVPVVVLQTNQTTLQESTFDNATIIRFLDAVVPAGHSVRIETSGTLVLGGDSPEEGLGSGTLGGELR